MLPTNVLRYGREAPLPERMPLRAGPLSLVYEGGDLRYVRLGDREILRRVYVAVRDRNWETVPAALSDVEMEIGGDSFRNTYRAEHVEGDIGYAWLGRSRGTRTARFVSTWTVLRARRLSATELGSASCTRCPVPVSRVRSSTSTAR